MFLNIEWLEQKYPKLNFEVFYKRNQTAIFLHMIIINMALLFDKYKKQKKLLKNYSDIQKYKSFYFGKIENFYENLSHVKIYLKKLSTELSEDKENELLLNLKSYIKYFKESAFIQANQFINTCGKIL